MTQREIFIRKIDDTRIELKTAGEIHSRDLRKQIKRMESELITYDQFRYEARKLHRAETVF